MEKIYERPTHEDRVSSVVKDYPIEESQWVPAENFMTPTKLQKYIEEDDPQEEKI